MGFKSTNSEDAEGINEINITPFVDVVLVLLVIFMVTAPMMVKDILGLELPKVSNSDGQSASTLGISVSSQGQIFLNGEFVTDSELQSRLQELVKNNPQVQAVIGADGNSKHADFVKVIDLIKSVGLENFAIQVEKSSASGAGAEPAPAGK